MQKSDRLLTETESRLNRIKKISYLNRIAYFFILNIIEVNYFFFKNSSTNSGDITLSTKVSPPVFGDLTILIALVNLFEDVCRVATVFFAMTLNYLISLCTVILFKIGLYFLISNLSGVFFLFFVVM